MGRRKFFLRLIINYLLGGEFVRNNEEMEAGNGKAQG